MTPLSLIVEDDHDLAEIFGQALTAAGYETEIIKDGLVAQGRLRQVVPAIIVLDMHLPKVSGDQLLLQIRADERLKDTRILLATADAQMAEHLLNDVDLVLVKPISFIQLRDLTSRFLSRSNGEMPD